MRIVTGWLARLRAVLSAKTTASEPPSPPGFDPVAEATEHTVPVGPSPVTGDRSGVFDLDGPCGATLSVAAVSRTSVGKVRRVNEDSLLDRSEAGLWAVADGVGGHQAGDYASQSLVAALGKLKQSGTLSDRMREIRATIGEVHEHLCELAEDRGDQLIGTTAVALVVVNSRYACLWVGDSRLYLYRDGALRRLTRDHSLVQDLVDRGVLLPEAAESHPQANVLTAAVGAGNRLKLELGTGLLEPDDLLLLCTDGLTRGLSDELIAALLDDPDLDGLADGLMAAALDAGGKDNVTLVVVRCASVGAEEGREEQPPLERRELGEMTSK